MKETDIGKLVLEWLRGNYTKWEFYQEIRPSRFPGSPIADIAGINNMGEVWVIELKTSLNLEVIRQAYHWTVDYRSVAYPLPKKMNASYDFWPLYIHKNMNIGSITVNPITGTVREKYVPRHCYVHTSYPKNQFVEILRSGKAEGFGEAGSREGGHWTPYKESIAKVREYIEKNPGCGVGDIVRGLGKLHYASEHSARTNLVKNLGDIESDWCEVKRKGNFDTFYVRKDV